MALPAATFVAADKTLPGRPFNLRSDGCSGPINPVYFKDAWVQHDFVYRNYRKSDGGLGLALTEAARSYADERFRVEMNRSCEAWAILAATAEDCLNQAAWLTPPSAPKEATPSSGAESSRGLVTAWPRPSVWGEGGHGPADHEVVYAS
ncbi:phospholipase A2 [Pseudonocardia sp. ICBG1142]|uniref:phospholipase A2 n=1 Tax=Pseudonocardia sp. ICBG1142 TaxID=2846760 RepID=UPI001CF6DB3D|nr:phospholipase A2 [Pseudonocardia sp. ICBG1142]